MLLFCVAAILVVGCAPAIVTSETGAQPASVGSGEKREVFFTMQNYADFQTQDTLLRELADEFKAETGITVNYEILNWSQAREKINLWHVSGGAPDVADLFWAYTYSDIGGGKYGTRPIEDLVAEYIPDLEDRFFASSLADVKYKGHLYGVPWRIGIYPLLYRADFFEEAGLDPEGLQTWDDLVEYAKALTIRDENGNVTRYGMAFLPDLAQAFYSWLWQAGGSFMDETYTQATIDTPAGREALQFIYDLVNVHQVAPIAQFQDPSFDVAAELAAGHIAMMPAANTLRPFIEANAPQLKEVIRVREPLRNKTQDAFQGAGYFGLTYDTRDVDAAMQWLAFLARDENMARLAIQLGQLSPNKGALEDPYFADDWWFSGQIKALPYGRTTQHPNPAWGSITNPQPGSPIYDMMIEVVTGEKSVEEALQETNQKMQQMMDEMARQ
ncbi:MAG: sugar ABC transporter substrate-binding protein [Caldilinea sp.]|nr:sugar ABC transporter substrate-binding protein [Caldilinea sp.]